MGNAPEGLALVCSAATAAEADLIRQLLKSAGFHVEFVPPDTTGMFGTTGSMHVHVRADEQEEAREFLHELQNSQAVDPDGQSAE
jgi:hypothetical protein